MAGTKSTGGRILIGEGDGIISTRLDLERLINNVSANFINCPVEEIEKGINHALKSIAEFAGAVRSSVFLFYDDLTVAANTYEWCADPADSQIDLLQEFPFDQFGSYTTTLKRLETVIVSRPADMPLDAQGERVWSDKYGFRPLLFVPMISEGSLYGTLGFYGKVNEEREWPEDFVLLLKFVADIFVNALERKRAEEELQKYSERLQEMVEERTIDLQREIVERKQLEEQLAAIYHLGQELTLLHDESSIVQRVSETAITLLQFETVVCGLVDEATNELHYSYGIPEPTGPSFSLADEMRGITVAVVHSGQALNVPDVTQDSRYLPLPGNPHIRSELCVPMKVDQRVIGVLNVESSIPNCFTAGDQQLLQTLADQTAVALENARLHTETEQWAERLAVLHELDQVITASLCIDEVYHAFARHFPRLLPCDRMSITLLEGDEETRVTYTFGGEEFLPPVGTLLPLKSSVIGWVVEQGWPLLLNDIADDVHLPQAVQTTATEIQSSMVIPLRVKGQVIGTWNIGSRQAGTYDSHDLEIAQAMADQLAIAIENARLHEQVQRYTQELEQRVADRTQELSALYNVTAVASESLDLKTTLERLLEQSLIAMRSNMGIIHLLDRAGERLYQAVQYGFSPGVVTQKNSVSLGSGLTNWVIEHGEPLIVPDVIADPRAIEVTGIGPDTTYVGVPIRARGQVLGVLGILKERKQSQFNVDEVTLLTSIADHVGVVVESARLRQQTEQAAVMEERARLARDLHDSVTQLLYSLTLFAKVGRESYRLGNLNQVDNFLTKIGKITQQALKEMRLLVYELRPSRLEQDGLVGTLQQRLDAVEERAGVKVDLLVDKTVELSELVEEGLYYIAQEALNNALKHAAAVSVTVRIYADDEQVELEVTDTGSGFDPDAVSSSGGLGLVGIRERAEKLGGVLTILSTPGKGTTIKISLETRESS